MKFEDMTIRQLISECEKMQKQLKNWESKMSAMNSMSENIKILGRQNKKLKRDNERYRRLLDRNPNQNVNSNNKKVTNDNILFELIVSDNTPLMLSDKVIGMVTDVTDTEDYCTCKIFKECTIVNLTLEDDNTCTVTSFEIKERDEGFE